MNDFSAAAAYQLSSARRASPSGLVVALYDTILRDLRRALAAVDSFDLEARLFELNHALTVIAGLHEALDLDRGGVAAYQLSRFYDVTRTMVLSAHVSGSREAIVKLIDLYGGIRSAWDHAERHLGSCVPVSLARFPVPPPVARHLVAAR